MEKNTNEYNILNIYKGKTFNKTFIKKYQKVIVFDLDETLGSFYELHILWQGINKILLKPFDSDDIIQNEFNKILDLYPEFLRYGILNILDYLYLKKKQNECDKIYVYTNNNCNPPWVSLICNYFKYALKFKDNIIDKTISAFKINNKILEISRTTKDKTHSDFIKCTLLPKSTEICFIDNSYFFYMLNEKVYYIQPKPYYHNLSTNTIIERFVCSSHLNVYIFLDMFQDKQILKDYLWDWFELNNCIKINNQFISNAKTIETDIIVAQKIMYHIKEFFYLTHRKNKTKKSRTKLTNTTRKKNI